MKALLIAMLVLLACEEKKPCHTDRLECDDNTVMQCMDAEWIVHTDCSNMRDLDNNQWVCCPTDRGASCFVSCEEVSQ